MPSPVTPSAYPLELPRPDIGRYRDGNNGIAWSYTFAAAAPGPHVMLSALVHGNELCGAIALDWLLSERVRPVRGRLSLCFMNVAAYESFDALRPDASRYLDEDFNRLWSDDVLDSTRNSVELRRAREVRPLVDTADLLLDIHSMQHPAAPLMLAGPCRKGRELAARIGSPQIIVADRGHAAGRRLRDYSAFADDSSPRNALLVECGQHWANDSARLAIDCAVRFLRATGTVDVAFGGAIGREALPPTQAWTVTDVITVTNATFTFAGNWTGGEVIASAGTLLGHDGLTPIFTTYDECMLVMPSRRLSHGQTAVRLARRT